MTALYSKTGLTADLIEALGEDAFVLLAEKFGGVRIFVPSEPSEELVDNIGADAAAKLCAFRGGEDINTPSAKKMRIAIYLARKWSVRKVALAVGLSEKSIYRHIERVKIERVKGKRQGRSKHTPFTKP